MKHTKEFYVLIGITIAIPLLIFAGMVIIGNYASEQVNPMASQTIIGDHNITFVLVNKFSDGFNDSWINHPSGPFDFTGQNFYFTNKTEFEKLEFNKKYSCNVTWSFLPWINSTLSDCYENI